MEIPFATVPSFSHMLRKGQLERIAKGGNLTQSRAINQLFGLTA
jgi:hypothetical protein